MASSFSSLTPILSSTPTCLHRCHHSTTRISSYSPPRPPLRRRGWSRISFVSRHPIADSNRYWNGKMYHASLHMASLGRNLDADVERKREVVEHIYLLKAKGDLSNEEEKNMLDHLYTTQYHMSGIVAISLGRTSDQNPQNYTHAVYMRFHRKQDLTRFYENPSYLQILKEHVMPHCHESKYVDFESEVMDDILSVFRKGEDFNYGVEFVLLIAFHASALGATAEGALASLEKLATEFPNLIVQVTQGSNFNPGSAEFTHGIVIRFRSTEALQLFLDSSEYKEMWNSKFQPVIQRAVAVQFVVDPVGTELM
ncbi:Stress-response A/B barrel domain-containing protein [Drosera capensis]